MRASLPSGRRTLSMVSVEPMVPRLAQSRRDRRRTLSLVVVSETEGRLEDWQDGSSDSPTQSSADCIRNGIRLPTCVVSHRT